MGRSDQAFLSHWHRRHLKLANGDMLRWVLIDDGARPPHAEAFRSARRGGIHPSEARRLPEAAGHPDAVHVREPDVGGGRFH